MPIFYYDQVTPSCFIIKGDMRVSGCHVEPRCRGVVECWECWGGVDECVVLLPHICTHTYTCNRTCTHICTHTYTCTHNCTPIAPILVSIVRHIVLTVGQLTKLIYLTQKGEKSACLTKLVNILYQKFRLSRLLPRTVPSDAKPSRNFDK